MSFTINPLALRRLSAQDRHLFIDFGVGPTVAAPYDRIHHAFEHYAALDPDAIAVSHLGDAITYGELDRRANRLATQLAVHGVSEGDHVGLFVRRSIDMVVGILGVLKAGAAYVPQDLRITPPSHLSHIIRTARTRVILTLSELEERIPPSDGQVVIALDRIGENANSADIADARVEPMTTSASDPTAVVIFTSGTTGRPNGVSVTHANVCNVLLNEPSSIGIGAGMKVEQILNIAFDMAVWEILGALSHGAVLVIRGTDIGAAVRQADVVIATPSILGSLDATLCHNVSIVAVAGERCPQPLADTWGAFTRFHNSCGPTEVTIVNTLDRYEPGKGELSIGRPLPNTTVYVLDAELKPCPIGVIGEMWAGGECVTAGYLGNDELTSERYRPDPFLGGGRRMFRTRDLGRWTTEKGQLEHHGRTDDLVKVQGFRVELDAVTSALELITDCAQATTLLHDGDLVGFVSPATVDVELARRVVEQTLPYYYVPRRILAVDDLPRTDRGKINKAMLRAALTHDQPVAIGKTAVAELACASASRGLAVLNNLVAAAS